MFDGQDEASTVKEGVLKVGGVAEDPTKGRRCRVRFRISLKEKLSSRSAERASMSTACLDGGFCKNCCILQAMRTSSLLAVVEV